MGIKDNYYGPRVLYFLIDQGYHTINKAQPDRSVNELRRIARNRMPESLLHAGLETALVADGQTSAAIAAQLHVSVLTVETHRRNLLQKFQVKSMTAAVKLAMEAGLLQLT